jgi:hypothetical protein
MKSNKHFSTILLFVLCASLSSPLGKEKAAYESYSKSERTPATENKVNAKPSKKNFRKLSKSNLRIEKDSLPVSYERTPQHVVETFEQDETIKVTKGFVYLSDIKAITKETYEPYMGEIIQERDGLIYFRIQNPQLEAIPVAMARGSKILYPISSILHLRKASQDLRLKLLSEGFEEYYYHSPLKFLSLKSTPGKVVSEYQKLKGRGFQVEMEVLRPPHRKI